MLSPQTLLLARYMDLLVMRQKVTATNIANLDTPGYRTRDLDFQIELARALDGSGLENPGPLEVHELGGLPVKNDGNDVHLDREMQQLSEAVMRYSLASMLVRGNVEAIRNAIGEGRTG
jgi:flagellar basal-body rod protein FlgB